MCLLCAVFALFASNISAQYAIELTVIDIEQSLSKKMGAAASALLTELNQVFFNGGKPQLTKISGLSREGQRSILLMWEMSPFRCVETEIIERACKTPTGWQIRNIPLFLKDMPEDKNYRELVIDFDKSGMIEDIYFSLDLHNYKEIMGDEETDVTDSRHRQAILNFVENFHMAYYLKDIDFLAKVFSEETLITTGKVIRQTRSVENVLDYYGFSKDKIDQIQIEYQRHTKRECINNLRFVFKNNIQVHVTFDNIDVVRHPKYDDIYGVRMKIELNTANYSDAGFLFLMVDFKDGENMLIHVRTWQPEKLNGVQLTEDEIFNLGDFPITNE